MTTLATYTVANRKEHPRILVLDDGWGFAARLQDEVTLPGTVNVVSDLDAVDQGEWDAIFLNQQLVQHRVGTPVPIRRLHDHLQVFLVLDPEFSYSVLDRVKGLNDAENPANLTVARQVPGREIRPKAGLDRALSASLIELADKREAQHGVTVPDALPEGMAIDAFALGPQGVAIAGKYAAPGRGEVWFVPTEVADFGIWAKAAFSSWRRIDAKKFPGIPDWWNSPEWFSPEERRIDELIGQETAAFTDAEAKYHEAIASLEAELETAQRDASNGIRQLLRGQDDLLQHAVREALLFLGFGVRNMDLEWDEKERREDFRISDPDDPDWLVLGDATGVRGNAKGGKITALQGYVTKYLHEEQPKNIPGMWYLLNREFDKDPNTRSTILREDEISPFAALKGLILDTTALFALTSHAVTCESEKTAIREYLRTTTGLIDLSGARTWLASR